jgi:hypothetical protein
MAILGIINALAFFLRIISGSWRIADLAWHVPRLLRLFGAIEYNKVLGLYVLSAMASWIMVFIRFCRTPELGADGRGKKRQENSGSRHQFSHSWSPPYLVPSPKITN